MENDIANENTRVDGEIVDERTNEIIPRGEIQRPQSNTLATSLDLSRVGTLVLDEKAEAVLSQPLEESDVQIRPDGLVYLPWTWFANRLNNAFGRLGWGLIPQANAQTKDMGNMVLVVWGHWLVIRGVPVGYEVGECAYRPDNHTMSFGDAAAGAKSNSLARNCKMLGMSLELWNQEWIEAWKTKYAETYKGNNGKTLWRKKANGGNGHQPQQPKVTEPAKAEEVKADSKATDSYTFAQLNTIPMVAQLAKESKKTKQEVAVFLNKMDKKVSYSIPQIVKLLGEQNAKS
jgi:hypothetical protein